MGNFQVSCATGSPGPRGQGGGCAELRKQIVTEYYPPPFSLYLELNMELSGAQVTFKTFSSFMGQEVLQEQ
jgi:hypothetical protein